MEGQRIVSILGWSGTGKTTLVEDLIGECRARGISVAAVKKSKHMADLPREAKDSSRFFAAGAAPSIYLGSDSLLIQKPAPATLDARQIRDACPEAELILCEGLDAEGSFRVLVAGAAATLGELKFPLEDVDMLVGRDAGLRAQAIESGTKAISPEDIALLADILTNKGDHQ